jgi:hypothetical protein
MSLIIKKNTTFKIPRTGSTALAGIDVANTSAFVAEFYETYYNLISSNGYFSKNSSSQFSLFGVNDRYLEYGGNWYIWDFSGKNPYTIYQNTSATNPLFIPETGWNGLAKFYTGTSPTIPYSTNSFVVTSAVGTMGLIVGLTFTKINSNTWTANGGEWIIQGSDLQIFQLQNYDGKNTSTYSQTRALSSGIPTFGWLYSKNIVFTPQ